MKIWGRRRSTTRREGRGGGEAKREREIDRMGEKRVGGGAQTGI